MLSGLSVDIEDWFQVGAFETCIDRADWDRCESRVERNTQAVLDMFAQAGATGTFFTLGWVAERHPALIRRIVAEGHELASHGYDHKRVFRMEPAEFRADLARARDLLEQAGGVRVTGYRAPSFSIDRRTPWAHEALAEAGYAYSSSVAPIRHDHYGWPEAPRFAFLPVADSDLVELPVTTARLGGKILPAGGGGFFRLLPYGVSRWALRQVTQADARPAILYFHPWEIDPAQPRVRAAPLRSRMRHYTNLSTMAGKLRRLLDDFRWTRIDALVDQERARAMPFGAAA